MKINGQQPNPVAVPTSTRETAAAGKGKTAESGAPVAGEERVELSSLARTLAALRTEVGDPEAIDAERVAELRDAIRQGTYEPPAREVADALLRELASNRIV